jgi:hypothetical protein
VCQRAEREENVISLLEEKQIWVVRRHEIVKMRWSLDESVEIHPKRK